MRKKLHVWLEKLRAEIRGETSLGADLRGRALVKTTLKPSIYAKVYRASEGKWYDLGKIT